MMVDDGGAGALYSAYLFANWLQLKILTFFLGGGMIYPFYCLLIGEWKLMLPAIEISHNILFTSLYYIQSIAV